MATEEHVSTYLEHLPAVLQEGPFIGRFLLAFEAILSGLPGEGPRGLEQILDGIDTYFGPQGAPADFLPWLAQWVATSLWDDWDDDTKRAFIANIVPLYRKRGTRAGLLAVLELCVRDVAVIDFDDDPTKPAHYFQVVLTIQDDDPAVLARRSRMVRAIVDREKPAHTFYGLSIRYPALRINNDPINNKAYGKGVLVGVNTILGTVGHAEKP